MAVTWQGFSNLVQSQVTAMVANAKALIDTSVGSITLAFSQSVAGVALWLQGEASRILALTRAATSNGTDLDSFYADFDFFRLGLVSATGQVTFSRYLATQQAVVLIGTVVTTGPGGLQFVVTTDSTNPAYSASFGGYVLPINTASVTVPAASLTAGTAGNVLANTIIWFFTPLYGIDTVVNASPFAGGIDAETDDQFRARFPTYLAGLQGGDEPSIQSAIEGVQARIRYYLSEQEDYPGNVFDPGNFFAIIDDGSGTPPTSLLTAVSLAINAKRAYGVRYQVYPPALVVTNVNMPILTASGYVHGSVAEQVSAAISQFLNTAPLDMMVVTISQLIQIARDTSPGVTDVPISTVLINGANANLVLTPVERPIGGTVTVT